jgi:hypothetical protein
MFQVKINGSPCPVKLSSHHFEQINLLGMNFLLGKKSLFYDIKQVKIVLTDYKEA